MVRYLELSVQLTPGGRVSHWMCAAEPPKFEISPGEI